MRDVGKPHFYERNIRYKKVASFPNVEKPWNYTKMHY